MVKKSLVLLFLVVFVGGGLFAQNNVVTIDIAPAFVGLGAGLLGNLITQGGSVGFGIGAQYEYQILDLLSVAGRFSYLGFGLNGLSAVNFKVDSFSLEGHVRLYPTKKAFFIDGMLGYGWMGLKFTGKSDDVTVNFNTSRNFFKLGGKLGWRVDFGDPGGFIFEPSFGYYGAIGIGDEVGDQLKKRYDGFDANGFNKGFWYIENLIFIGGPRLSLAFGWRF